MAGMAGAGYSRDWSPFLWLAGLLVLSGLLAWVVTLAWTAWIVHRPPRMTAGRALARLGRATPADVGIASFEEVAFNVPRRDRAGGEATLAGWWIPHAGGTAVHRTCILLHGYGDSRAGALAWASVWRRLGFHLLLLDLRAHGDSGGKLAGGGAWERDDLHRVIDALRDRHPSAARTVVLFGVSYGAMVAAACCAQRNDIAALVIDSPVDGWSTATRRYAELLGLPLAHAHGLRLALAERWLGVRFEETRPVNTLAEVRCPVLAILPREDVLVSPAESEAIASRLEAGGRHLVWHAATSHNLAIATHPEAYERQVQELLMRAGLWEAAPVPAAE